MLSLAPQAAAVLGNSANTRRDDDRLRHQRSRSQRVLEAALPREGMMAQSYLRSVIG
jgi:hypothetical protein